MLYTKKDNLKAVPALIVGRRYLLVATDTRLNPTLTDEESIVISWKTPMKFAAHYHFFPVVPNSAGVFANLRTRSCQRNALPTMLFAASVKVQSRCQIPVPLNDLKWQLKWLP